MRGYKKVYLNHFGYGEQDYVPCENCGKPCNDIHHLTFRSQGGSDEIENLIGVCRACHDMAHNNRNFNEQLRKIHLKILQK